MEVDGDSDSEWVDPAQTTPVTPVPLPQTQLVEKKDGAPRTTPMWVCEHIQYDGLQEPRRAPWDDIEHWERINWIKRCRKRWITRISDFPSLLVAWESLYKREDRVESHFWWKHERHFGNELDNPFPERLGDTYATVLDPPQRLHRVAPFRTITYTSINEVITRDILNAMEDAVNPKTHSRFFRLLFPYGLKTRMSLLAVVSHIYFELRTWDGKGIDHEYAVEFMQEHIFPRIVAIMRKCIEFVCISDYSRYFVETHLGARATPIGTKREEVTGYAFHFTKALPLVGKRGAFSTEDGALPILMHKGWFHISYSKAPKSTYTRRDSHETKEQVTYTDLCASDLAKLVQVIAAPILTQRLNEMASRVSNEFDKDPSCTCCFIGSFDLKEGDEQAPWSRSKLTAWLLDIDKRSTQRRLADIRIRIKHASQMFTHTAPCMIYAMNLAKKVDIIGDEEAAIVGSKRRRAPTFHVQHITRLSLCSIFHKMTQRHPSIASVTSLVKEWDEALRGHFPPDRLHAERKHIITTLSHTDFSKMDHGCLNFIPGGSDPICVMGLTEGNGSLRRRVLYAMYPLIPKEILNQVTRCATFHNLLRARRTKSVLTSHGKTAVFYTTPTRLSQEIHAFLENV